MRLFLIFYVARAYSVALEFRLVRHVPPKSKVQKIQSSVSLSSRGLGQRPFKPPTGVRIPAGTPYSRLHLAPEYRLIRRPVRVI